MLAFHFSVSNEVLHFLLPYRVSLFMVVLLLTSSLQDYLRKNQLPGNGIVAFFSSIMARSPDKIKNIDGSKETLKLSMRITDLWFIGTPNKSEQAEMVFVDSDVCFNFLFFFLDLLLIVQAIVL